jgi:transposase
MMGTKTRSFSPLPRDDSLEDLVPKDHFYRRLEERINLSFVRELVLPLYASGGRHSIDPVVFFKLQLVLFFENLRSERRLMEVVADRLSLRWYVGYDLHESLPDHSSLTKIREHYGLEIFRDFFERIVEMCFEAGLVRSRELFFDSTKIEADAAVDSLAPRWYVEAHLRDLFEGDDVRRQKGAEDYQRNGGDRRRGSRSRLAHGERRRPPPEQPRERRLDLSQRRPGPLLQGDLLARANTMPRRISTSARPEKP